MTDGSAVVLEVRERGSESSDRAVLVPLRHGADIPPTLAAAGWHEPEVVGASRPTGSPGTVLIGIEAVRGPVGPEPDPVALPADPQLVVAEGEVPAVHQRLAAYAWVVEDGDVLLTQLSERVHLAPGRWNLPGGGVDPGEDPVAGLVREVWEETGQRLEPGELLDVHTQHWLGRAPSGQLEDFQAVRLVYAGRVRQRTEPVIHDIGGSTSAARWVPLRDLDALPVVDSVTTMRARTSDGPGTAAPS